MSNTFDKPHHVTATFKTRGAAASAIDNLCQSGFAQSDISMLVSDETRGSQFVMKEGTKSEEYSATGAAAGGAFGAIAALLMSAAVIPAVGFSIVAVGPLFATLAGLGAGGLTGGVVGALAGLGVPEHEAKLYEKDLRDGKILLAVETANKDERDLAERVLKECDAVKVAA